MNPIDKLRADLTDAAELVLFLSDHLTGRMADGAILNMRVKAQEWRRTLGMKPRQTPDEKLQRKVSQLQGQVKDLQRSRDHWMVMAAKAEIERTTPNSMAEQFWEMSSGQQVEFFEHLGRVIQARHDADQNAYSMGEVQWHFMASRMEHNQMARDMLQAMAAPLYLHTLRAAERLAA